MQTGVFQGYMGLITHILKKMAAEVKCRPLIIATGGLASLLCPELKMIKKQDIDLTLHGLRIVYENIRKNNLDW
jgi:type III pantothenate kinase